MAEPFEFSDVQAEHILDMPLGRLTRLARIDLETRIDELRQEIADLEAILADDGTAAHGDQGRAARRQGEVRHRAAQPRSPSTPAR